MGMSIEEFYRQICGDYAAVSARLPRAELIERFIGRFLEMKALIRFAGIWQQETAGRHSWPRIPLRA